MNSLVVADKLGVRVDWIQRAVDHVYCRTEVGVTFMSTAEEVSRKFFVHFALEFICRFLN